MLLIKGAERRIFRWKCQEFLAKKWGILIKKESESLDLAGLKIPRDYGIYKGSDMFGKSRKDYYCYYERTIKSRC